MHQLNAAPLLRGLKNGPGCSIILLFLANPLRSLGTSQICQGTGWTRKPVSDALATLAHYGILQNHGRYHGWRLTSHGRQLMLGETLGLEGENFLLGSCSSSDPKDTQMPPDQQLQPTSEGEILHLPNEWEHLVNELRRDCSIPPKLARPALATALQRGDTLDEIRTLANAWHDYSQSPAAANIDYPPALICARVADGTPAPALPQPATLDAMTTDQRRAYYERWGIES